MRNRLTLLKLTLFKYQENVFFECEEMSIQWISDNGESWRLLKFFVSNEVLPTTQVRTEDRLVRLLAERNSKYSKLCSNTVLWIYAKRIVCKCVTSQMLVYNWIWAHFVTINTSKDIGHFFTSTKLSFIFLHAMFLFKCTHKITQFYSSFKVYIFQENKIFEAIRL